jgi:hypothetical protein
MRSGRWWWWWVALLAVSSAPVRAQQIDEDKLGAWYMYIWNHDLQASRFGLQGDVQYRAWNLGDDPEQLLFRGGVTWRPRDTSIKLTLGFASMDAAATPRARSGSIRRR